MAHHQPCLDLGPETRREPPDRFTGSNLFIAARPDPAAAAAALAIATDLRHQYRIERQPLSRSRLHVSLIGLGCYPALPDSLIYHVREALDGVRFEPFEIAFDRIASLGSGSSRPAVLCASAPDPALWAALGRLADRLRGLGVDLHYRPDFLVHMTLVYHSRPVTPERLDMPICWTIDRFWLIHSLLGRSSYEFLWPLVPHGEAAYAPSAERRVSSLADRRMSTTAPPGS